MCKHFSKHPTPLSSSAPQHHAGRQNPGPAATPRHPPCPHQTAQPLRLHSARTRDAGATAHGRRPRGGSVTAHCARRATMAVPPQNPGPAATPRHPPCPHQTAQPLRLHSARTRDAGATAHGRRPRGGSVTAHCARRATMAVPPQNPGPAATPRRSSSDSILQNRRSLRLTVFERPSAAARVRKSGPKSPATALISPPTNIGGGRRGGPGLERTA